MSEKTMVLLSGGQDSATCLLWAIYTFGKDNVMAICFDYGQSHKIEIKYAEKLCERLGIELHTVNIPVSSMGQSSLTMPDEDHNKKHPVFPELPASFTPGRNLLFLSIAMPIALNNNCLNLVTGICQTDYSGYPDCREEFRSSVQDTINLALGLPNDQTSKVFQVIAPLMYLSKGETWKLVKSLESPGDNFVKLIVEETITGYDGDETLNEWGRGNENNPASALRIKGYFEAKQNGWI